MVNTINTLTERNKELLNKIEELEREINSFPSREQQLEVLNRIEGITQQLKERDKKWKKELSSWMWKHKNYRLNTKTFKYHEKQATSEDGEYHSKIFISTTAFHLWDEKQKRSITEEDNPLESYLGGLIYQFSYLTGRAIGYEDKIKELKEELSSKGKLTREQKAEISKLSEELKEKETLVRELAENLKMEENNADTHFEAIKVCEEWYLQYHIAPLNKEVANKSDLLQASEKIVENQNIKIKKLEKELAENSELLKGAQKLIENQNVLLQLYDKPLPSLPKTQAPNKFKIFKEKAKTKLQNLVEKTKHRSQEFIAKIEVKVK